MKLALEVIKDGYRTKSKNRFGEEVVTVRDGFRAKRTDRNGCSAIYGSHNEAVAAMVGGKATPHYGLARRWHRAQQSALLRRRARLSRRRVAQVSQALQYVAYHDRNRVLPEILRHLGLMR